MEQPTPRSAQIDHDLVRSIYLPTYLPIYSRSSSSFLACRCERLLQDLHSTGPTQDDMFYLDHAEYTGPTRQHELDHTGHTDHIDNTDHTDHTNHRNIFALKGLDHESVVIDDLSKM